MLRETRGASWHPVNWSEGLDVVSWPHAAAAQARQSLPRDSDTISRLFRVHSVEAFAAHLILVLAVGASPPVASGVQGLGDRSVLPVLVPGGLGTPAGHSRIPVDPSPVVF